MKIAVPTRDNYVDEHFGHCEYYTVFSIENGKIQNKEILDSPQGCGCKSNIASVLKEMNVTTMLAGNMGAGAQNVLGMHGINVIRGCSGNVDEVVNHYLAGNISDSGVSCSHHDHHHGSDGHVCNH
ncbi:MAG: NifB/NifX family molybdenum-iron cluster-binding protein [Bacteroidales bacterium]